MTKCFHHKHSWTVCLHLCPRQKKKHTSLQRGTGHNKDACIRTDESEPRAWGSIHLYLMQACGSEQKQLPRNDQDCRGMIILGAGTNNRLRKSKKDCFVLDWACGWHCEHKKIFQQRGIGDGRKSKGSVSSKPHLPWIWAIWWLHVSIPWLWETWLLYVFIPSWSWLI